MKIGIDARTLTDRNTGLGNHTENLLRLLPLIAKDINWIYFLSKKKAGDLIYDNVMKIRVPSWDARFIREWYLNISLPKLLNNLGADIFIQQLSLPRFLE